MRKFSCKSRRITICMLLISLLLYNACEEEEFDDPGVPHGSQDLESGNHIGEVIFSDDFESGSIGDVVKIANNKWDFYLADDNGDVSLPDEYRSWWYLKIDNAPTNGPITFTVKNRGWPFYYVPVYSYDNVRWFRFNESEVYQNTNKEIVVTTTFSQSEVWIARFYPYTFSDLERFISEIEKHAFVEVEVPGYSQREKPIYLLKVTHPNLPSENKKRVFIHARTHPAETPGSYVVEGLVKTLLNNSPESVKILSTHEFYIFPMHNVDGVIAGNYRTTPKSENLEVLWKYDPLDPLNLIDGLPLEVNVIHEYAKNLMTDGGPKVSIALNLHGSNSEPDTRPFFFPHFGTREQGYCVAESNLWYKQLFFIDQMTKYYGQDMLEPTPDEGGSGFVNGGYPEAWWWAIVRNAVMAMTMEVTYDRAGYAPDRITQDNMRYIGESLMFAIRDYHEFTAENSLASYRSKIKGTVTGLKYPELYPPDAQDELKK